MSSRITVILIALLSAPFAVWSQSAIQKGSVFDSLSEAQQEWILRNVEDIKNGVISFEEKDTLPQRISKYDGKTSYEFKLNSKGIIRFKNRSWVKMVSHSSHADKKIGDLTLVMTNKGEVFINRGHICGGTIRFYTHFKIRRLTVAKFLKHYLDETDDFPFVYVMKVN